MATRAQLKNFYEDRKPYIQEMIGMGFKEHPTIFTRFLNQKTTGTGWIDVNTVSEYGLFAHKPELQVAALDEVQQGPTMRLKVLTYAKRVEISEEMVDDDMGDGIIANRVPGIAKAARRTMEILGHDMINSGFGSVVTPDGKSLFNTAHTNIDGTTQSNIITSNPDFSQTALETAITQLRMLKGDRGEPIVLVPKRILCHPSNEWAVKVVLNSAQVTASANNDINPMANENLEVVSSPFFTDVNAWVVQCDSHDLNWYTRQALGNWSRVDESKFAVEVGAKFRSASGVPDWRGVIGSTGS